jgi:hypothetical protein
VACNTGWGPEDLTTEVAETAVPSAETPASKTVEPSNAVEDSSPVRGTTSAAVEETAVETSVVDNSAARPVDADARPVDVDARPVDADAPNAAQTTDVRTASAALRTTHVTSDAMAVMDAARPVDAVDAPPVDAPPVDALAVRPVDAPPVDVDAWPVDVTPPEDAEDSVDAPEDVPPVDAEDSVDAPFDAEDSVDAPEEDATFKSRLNRVFSLVHRYLIRWTF